MNRSRNQVECVSKHVSKHVSNRVSSRALVGVLVCCAGLAGSLEGCKGQQPRGGSVEEPVNTGLAAMSQDDELLLPSNDDLLKGDAEFGSVSEQLEESARQLNVYFANMEIDGVEPGKDSVDGQPGMIADGASQIADGETQILEVPVESVVEPIQQAQNQSTSITPSIKTETKSASDDGGGVRVSLLGGGGQSVDGDEDRGAVDEVAKGEGMADDGTETGTRTGAEQTAEQSAEHAAVEAVDPQVRKEQLAHELASILSQLASTSDDPGAAALALASLETLLPEGADAGFDEGMLSDAEKTSLDAVRGLLKSISSGGEIVSPGELASDLERIQEQLDAWAGLTITKAALCTRVDGYGRYETFPSYRFIAGRAQDVIVYVELERFTQRELTGPDGQARYQTKLSQRLELYHAVDDLNAWNRRAETVSDETRNRLRDYYLTNMVTLPANLGVGRYHLKIVTRDLIGERVAETIIPIEIVAR